MDLVSLAASASVLIGKPQSQADPSARWDAYVVEAANRFRLPTNWIYAVMRAESGGHQTLNGQPTTSTAGAMGLMQLMPATWTQMRTRYRLGPDPYDPHDNILAGAAYLRAMYDRYGSPVFLAAYNAGPGRLDAYLLHDRQLPVETRLYFAALRGRLDPRAIGHIRPQSPPSLFAVRHDGAPISANGSSLREEPAALFVSLHDEGGEAGLSHAASTPEASDVQPR